MKIPMDFDNKEYFELLWMYERLQKEITKENEREAKRKGQLYLTQNSNLEEMLYGGQSHYGYGDVGQS